MSRSSKEIFYDSSYGKSKLKLELSNTSYHIVNSIRREIFTSIPIYAFTDTIIDYNTSYYINNDHLKETIKHLPVYGIDKNSQMVISLSFENNTPDNYIVTTSDAEYYLNDKKIECPYKIPMVIIILKPQEKISFSSTTTLGTEQDHVCYTAVAAIGMEEIKSNTYTLTIESTGQLKEYTILNIAIDNLINRLTSLLNIVKNLTSLRSETFNNNEGTIVIENEDHTLGSLIVYGLQQHKKILTAAYCVPHPHKSEVHLIYKTEKTSSILQTIEETVELLTHKLLSYKKT